jgi:uncharacterized protein (TIGR03435 family)
VESTAATIAETISAHSIQAAPLTLAKTAAALALAHGATAPASTLTLINGALKIMAWTNAKTALVVGLGIVLAVGTTTLTIKEVGRYREASVWDHVTLWVKKGDVRAMQHAPALVAIRHTKFFPLVDDLYAPGSSGKLVGLAVPTAGVFGHAYDVNRTRIVNPELLPGGRYDFVVTLATNQLAALQAAVEDTFGLVGKRETRDTDVLVLELAQTNAPGLTPTSGGPRSRPYWSDGYVKYDDTPIPYLAYTIERQIKIPVIDQTGLTGRYDIAIKWSGSRQVPGLDEVKQVLLDQLGLRVVSTNMPLEVLVLQKTR